VANTPVTDAMPSANNGSSLVAHRYRVLRFWNNEVLRNIEGVWDKIFAAASAAAPPHPDPLPASGERESPSRTPK
jgi:Protein of unknown function (DUF559)